MDRSTKLDLSLPEAPRRRGPPGILLVLTFLAASAAVVLLVLERRERPPEAAGASPAEADRLKALAADLERRTLHGQAAAVWGQYLAAAPLTPEEMGLTLYRQAKCLMEAGLHAEAARCLTESEAYPVPRDDKRRAAQLLLECLQALGKEDAFESASRAFAVRAEETGTVVARVGKDAITKEDLREELKSGLEHALKLQGAALAPAEISARATDLADKELADPESAMRAVSQAVSARLLYREGLERGFGQDEETAKAVSRIRRQLIAERVIAAEVEAALKALGPTEISNHYEAHKERFVEKPSVEFSSASWAARGEAEEAVRKLKDPSAATEVALEKAKAPAVEGEPVPGIGPSAEALAHLLALDEGESSDRPIEHDGRFYVFRAEKKRPRRQLALDEAEPMVRADLGAAKRKDALEALRKLLAEKFQVEVVEQAITGKAPAAAPPPGAAPAGQPGPAPAGAPAPPPAAGKKASPGTS
jgi:hypothetical protein